MSRLVLRTLVSALCAGIGYPVAAESFVLVADGRMAARIEATGNAQIDEDIAFFTNAVNRMSGAGAAGGDAAGRVVFDVVEANLFEEDAYEISFPDAATMKIRGTDQSCRWALNALLEEQGVVFCYPGSEGTHWPQRKTVAWEIKRRQGAPSLRLQRQLWAENKEWERCLSGKTYFGNFQNHSMFLIFPKEKYAHAAIFEKIMPLRGGKRIRPLKEKWDMRWQPCFASEESVSEAVRNICEELDKDPRKKVFSLSVNDLEGYCECDGCKALNGGSFDRLTKFGTSKNRDHSPSYYSWANKVAERVTRKHPHAVFGCLAYCGTIDPPPFDLHPSIVPFLCQDVSKIGDEKEFSKQVGLIREWSKRAKALGFWDYGYGCRHYVIPRLYTGLQKKFFAKKDEFDSIQSYFCEGSSFMGEGPKRYLYYKLMWNHKIDVEAEIDRWCKACVGEAAAGALKEYYGVWENFWRSPALKRTPWYVTGMRGLYFNYAAKDYVFALTRQEFDRARALMRKVVALADASGDALQRARAARLADYHAFYESRMIACGAFRSAYDGTFADEGEAAAFVGALGEMCRAQKRAEELAERICAYRLKDEPKAKWACESFRKQSTERLSVTVLFNSLAGYLDSPAVAAATRSASQDPDLSDEMRRVLRGISDLGKLADVSWGRAKTADEDFAAWHRARRYGIEVRRSGEDGRLELVQTQGWSAATKIVMGLKKGGNYLFRATLHNTTERPLHVIQIFASQRDDLPNGNEGGGGGSETQRRYTVAPGQSVKMCLFGRISNRYSAARLYIIPSLNAGEKVLVDGVSLLDLESE